MQPSSTTTTTKARWMVEKFSRSKSPSRGSRESLNSRGSGSFSEAASKRSAYEAIEWEHRSQKQHYLELETVSTVSTVSADGSAGKQLQRMYLNIIFDSLARSHPETPSPSHQQISLLSLDLTSFSSSAIAACTPQDQLPLKAVHKGTVLGLRYLHVPLEERSKGRYASTEWKRVQVKFVSVEERKRCVEAIKGVCPVKLADGATEAEQQLPSPKKSRTSREREGAGTAVVEDSVGAASAQKPAYEATQDPRVAITTSPLPRPLPTPAPFLPPRSTTCSTASQPLPPSIAALLPKLTNTLKPNASTGTPDRTSVELAEMDEAAFGALFAEIIAEGGFDKLVERVQGHLKGV